MTIVFISNFHNHHQIPLCDELTSMPDVEFTFIATEKVPQDRIELGYQFDFNSYSYYFEALTPETIVKAEQLCYESDVVIRGSAPVHFVERRMRENKLTFQYSERLFKDGFWKHPGDIWRGMCQHTKYRSKQVYMLCASAYTAPDCHKIFAYPKKTFKWGYFPKTYQYQLQDLFGMKQTEQPHLLWVGRFLDWKHPDDFVRVCKALKQEGLPFTASMIGIGDMKETIKNEISESGLSDVVQMYDGMSPEAVRSHMEKADIFLFTSDKREGWGAVLGEAMNCGCAVVAAKEAGSTMFLMEDGKNGFTYSTKDYNELLHKTRLLVKSNDLRFSLGKNAATTMMEQWNAATAAQRLYQFCKAALNRQPHPVWKFGPMSKAEE